MKKSETEDTIKYQILNVVPYQICPKCNGQGFVGKPPHIAGDVHQWTSNVTQYTCDVCNGKKIIPMHIVSDNN